MRTTYRILAILVALSSGSVCAIEHAQDSTVMLAPVDGPEAGRVMAEPSAARKTIVRRAKPPVKKPGDTQTYAEPGTVGNMNLPPSAESEARAALSAVPSAQVQANQLPANQAQANQAQANQAQANQARAAAGTATQVPSQAPAQAQAANSAAKPAVKADAKTEPKAQAKTAAKAEEKAVEQTAQSEPPPLDVTPSIVRKIRIRKRTEPAPVPVVRAPVFAPMKDDLGPSEPSEAPARESSTETPKAAAANERAAEDNPDQAAEAKSAAASNAVATTPAATQPAAVQGTANQTQAASPQVTQAEAGNAEASKAEASKAQANDANTSAIKEVPTAAGSAPTAAKLPAEAAQPMPEVLTQNQSKPGSPSALPTAADLTPLARSNECDPPLQAEVMALFDRWNAALRSGDLKQMLANYAPNALLLPTGSSRAHFTQADKADYFAPLLKRRPEASIDDRYIDVDCNSATNAGLYTFRFSDGSQVKARYSFSYKRMDGQWLISSHHSSAMPNSAAVTAPVTTSINAAGADKPFSDKLVGDKPLSDKSLAAKSLADKQAKPVAALKHTVDSGPTQGWVRFP